MRLVRIIFLFCIATAIGAAAQTFTVLYSYNQTQLYPNSFVQGVDGNIYGTTQGAVETGFGGLRQRSARPILRDRLQNNSEGGSHDAAHFRSNRWGNCSAVDSRH